MKSFAKNLPLDENHLRPGQRVCVAVSGGADSVALLRALFERRKDLGLVLSVVHVHHGMRGAEAENDVEFVRSLACQCDLPFHVKRVDTPGQAVICGETLEEAARNLRYAFFRELLQQGKADAVATAHTLDDQAETVLQKLLRGAWTEGLGGISPLVQLTEGIIVRPLLKTTRAEVEAWLRSLHQPWCDDSTNADEAFTRNRIRHHLLPILRAYNPQIAMQLDRTATIARDEEAYWQHEIERLAQSFVLPGKPVRGGGRATSTHPEEASLAIELERLRPLGPAIQRRLLRWAALQLGEKIDFDHTERLMQMCGFPSVDLEARSTSAKRLELNATLVAQRSAREIQFFRRPAAGRSALVDEDKFELTLPVPGHLEVPVLGLSFRTEIVANVPALDAAGETVTAADAKPGPIAPALFRYTRPGDRVHQRHTGGPRKIKDILERMRVPASDRRRTPVVVWPAGSPEQWIVWMGGVELEPASLPVLPFTLTVNPT